MSLPLIMVALTLLQAPGRVPARAPADSARPAGGKAGAAAASRDALALQVMLDRAGFSPGVIDGRPGKNTEKALAMYKESGRDAEGAAPVEPIVKYTVTPEDVAGPFAPDIPSDLMAQSKLEALAYRNVLELLAERFHATPAFLQRLNPGATFAAGETISVPNVEPLIVPVERLKSDSPHPPAPGAQATAGRGAAAPAKGAEVPAKPTVVVSVSKAASALTVKDDSGRVIFYAPVTTGSEHDPLPIGEWKINGVQMNPTFRYNPKLFWDADPTHSKAQIPAGPNNPVGLVWIDLSKEHYGIHGTPEPSVIGRAQSHGCVRMTNWDALKLAGLVKPGTRVVFTE
jgi:lipoprotein-anchoring transpeptidase ErfK/SrfK